MWNTQLHQQLSCYDSSSSHTLIAMHYYFLPFPEHLSDPPSIPLPLLVEGGIRNFRWNGNMQPFQTKDHRFLRQVQHLEKMKFKTFNEANKGTAPHFLIAKMSASRFLSLKCELRPLSFLPGQIVIPITPSRPGTLTGSIKKVE